MGGSAPSGPTAAQQQQLAQEKADLRKKQQKIANQQVASLRRASSEGGLLRGLTPTLLGPPPSSLPSAPVGSGGIFGRGDERGDQRPPLFSVGRGRPPA